MEMEFKKSDYIYIMGVIDSLILSIKNSDNTIYNLN